MKVAHPQHSPLSTFIFIPHKNRTKYNTLCSGVILISPSVQNIGIKGQNTIKVFRYFLETLFLNGNKKYKIRNLQKSPKGLML